jgi:3-deoxy-D-manno-octulosonic-acid transferase
MPRPSLFFRLTALGARILLPVAGLVRPRLRRMAAERRELLQQVHPGSGPGSTILLHAASAGELRQLEPLIPRLRQRLPDARLVVTWFSTSGALVGRALGADLAGALPWDTPWETGAFLDRLKPSLIVVGKLDLWPELAWQAERRGIPVALVAATVRWNSSRLSWPTRAILAPAYASLSAVGAISDEDAKRLIQLGVSSSRISITGDSRYDSAVERLVAASPVPRDPWLMVAGSTWPVDELLLLHSLAEVRARHPEARLLIVPHQPNQRVLDRISGLASALGLPAPGTSVGAPSPLIVDLTVGGLALTYRRGGIAYVGGGLNLSGPHSVLEPAAAGLPVMTGDMSSSRDALLLESAGALVRLDHEGAMNELPRRWGEWLSDAAAREQAGEAGKRLVEAMRGAADRTVALIERMVRDAGEKSR